MSPPQSVNPLVLSVRPSRRLLHAFALAHLGAVLCLISLPLAGWVCVLLGALALVNFGLLTSRHALRTARDAIVGVLRRPDGHWVLTTARGAAIEATRLPGAYVHPELVVVRFRAAGRARRMVLLLVGDAVSPREFRRLRRALGSDLPLDS